MRAKAAAFFQAKALTSQAENLTQVNQKLDMILEHLGIEVETDEEGKIKVHPSPEEEAEEADEGTGETKPRRGRPKGSRNA